MALTPRVRLFALLGLAVVAVFAACEPVPTATPTPSPTPTRTPTPSPTATPTPSPTPTGTLTPAQLLRARADAFAHARTRARFDDAYQLASPSIHEECDPGEWLGWLAVDASITRAFNSLDDDAPLRWEVQLADIQDATSATVVVTVLSGNRPLDAPVWSWSLVDGQWWFDEEPPGDTCA